MNNYSTALFLQIEGVSRIFAAFDLEWMGPKHPLGLVTSGQVREWMRISKSVYSRGIVYLLTILICGFYFMATASGGLAQERRPLDGRRTLLILGAILTVPGARSEVQGSVIGWGTGQAAEAVAQTRAVIATLTSEKVKEMNTNGLHKEWVQRQLKMYRKSIAKGVGSPAKPNTQVFPRQELIEKILALWPE